MHNEFGIGMLAIEEHVLLVNLELGAVMPLMASWSKTQSTSARPCWLPVPLLPSIWAEAAPSALYCIVVSCHCLPASYCELLQHLHHCMKSDLGMVES